jgi:hypothetical protein
MNVKGHYEMDLMKDAARIEELEAKLAETENQRDGYSSLVENALDQRAQAERERIHATDERDEAARQLGEALIESGRLRTKLAEAERERDIDHATAQNQIFALQGELREAREQLVAIERTFETDFRQSLLEDDPGDYELPVDSDGVAQLSHNDIERIVRIAGASLANAADALTQKEGRYYVPGKEVASGSEGEENR